MNREFTQEELDKAPQFFDIQEPDESKEVYWTCLGDSYSLPVKKKSLFERVSDYFNPKKPYTPKIAYAKCMYTTPLAAEMYATKTTVFEDTNTKWVWDKQPASQITLHEMITMCRRCETGASIIYLRNSENKVIKTWKLS